VRGARAGVMLEGALAEPDRAAARPGPMRARAPDWPREDHMAKLLITGSHGYDNATRAAMPR